MKLHMLGTAGYHRNEFRETSCMMIPDLGIVLDAGSGFSRVRKLLPLVPEGLPLHVFISHGHIDHTIGLTFGVSTRFANDRQIVVSAEPAHLKGIEEHLFGSELFPLPIGFPKLGISRLDPVVPEQADVSHVANGVPFTAARLPHPGGSTGYRLVLPNGKHLVYITDTTADDVPLDFVAGADTLIHECNFVDDVADLIKQFGLPDPGQAFNMAQLAKVSGHSTTSQVLNLAKRAGVKRLVLTHWNSLIEDIVGSFIEDMTCRDLSEQLPFELVLAKDGLVIDL